MADIDNVKMAQGPAKPATAEDLQRDAVGITNPNLHRRIDNDLSFISEDVALSTENDDVIGTNDGDYVVVPTRVVGGKADYTVSVGGLNSYRTTERITHDEDSTTEEIP